VTQKHKKKTADRCSGRPAGASLGMASKRRYELHVQSQPSSQSLQQSQAQLQSGHPWQQSS
jgi:hypothetical protein